MNSTFHDWIDWESCSIVECAVVELSIHDRGFGECRGGGKKQRSIQMSASLRDALILSLPHGVSNVA